MELELGGQAVVVWGGAQGIGLAIARAFAVEGAGVLLADADRSAPEVAAALSAELGAVVEGSVADMTDGAAVDRVAATAVSRFGRIDHVVVAAAVGSGQFGMPFWNVDPERWERVLRVNVVGPVLVAHAFGPGMAERRTGSLLFLGSVAGQNGSPTDPPYSASKAALINFMQCAARDLAPYGVRVNVINPGMVRTALNRSVWAAWNAQQAEEARVDYESWTAEKIQKVVPLGRWQEPEDIAAMAVFLASARGRNITGQCLNVDGGYVMRG